MISSNRIYFYSSAIAIGLFLVIGLVTLPDYGMGWDEQVRWESGDLKLEYYQSLLSGEAADMKDIMVGDRYPGLFDLPLAAFHAIFGGDRMLQGHLWSLLFGVLGLISVNCLANVVFGPRTAFFSTVLLLVLPHFYGHAMINPKDIPFMATYCLGLASVMWITRRLLDGEPIQWRSYLACGLAIGLAASSRIPGLVLLVMALAFWSMAFIWTEKSLSRTWIFPLLKGSLIMAVSAFAVLLVFFPRLHFQLLTGVTSVTSSLHSSAGAIPLLFAGRVMDAMDAPAYYAQMFFLVSTPIWMLVLLIAGILFSGQSLVSRNRELTARSILLACFFLLSAFPWVYILITRPALHNGMRHLLFGIPPLVVLMGFGLHSLLDRIRDRSRPIRTLSISLVVLLMAAQVIHLVRMHPYQYVSFNLLAGDKATVINRYEGEYWFTSTRHLLEALPGLVPVSSPADNNDPIKIRISGPLDSARPFVPDGFQLVDSFEEAAYYISNTTFRTDLLAEGETVYRISRGRIPIAVIKKLPER